METMRNIKKELEEALLERPFGLYKNLFDKLPAPYFGFIGYSILSSSIFIALILYNIEDPSFNIFHNWISHLSVGPNGSNVFFFIGFSAASPFILLFHYSFINSFYYKTRNVDLLLFLYTVASIQSLGSFLVGFFPLNLHRIHGVVAYMYFFGGFLFYSGLFYTYTITKEDNAERLILSGVSAVVTIIFLFAFVYSVITNKVFIISNYLLEWLVYTTYLVSNFRFALISLDENKSKKV